MRNSILGGVVSTVIALNAAACGTADNRLPQRRDCIVRIDLNWPVAPVASERELVIDKIVHDLSRASATLGKRYRASIAIPRDARTALYLQFEQDCQARLEMADELLVHVRNNVERVPRMTIVSTAIEPGPETIDVWGPEWSDRPQ